MEQELNDKEKVINEFVSIANVYSEYLFNLARAFFNYSLHIGCIVKSSPYVYILRIAVEYNIVKISGRGILKIWGWT